MNENSSLFESHYLRRSKDFVSECDKRNLRFDNDFLIECKKYSLLSPVLEYKNDEYYDLFQIAIVGVIYDKIKIFSDIATKAEEIKKSISELEQILPLLYEIRYFYQDKMHGFITTGIIPPFKLTEEEIIQFSNKVAEIFDNAKDKYKPANYLAKYNLTKERLWEIRDNIFREGRQIDPMVKWYPFIRTIRQTDTRKFDDIKKVVLLAHDYYIIAELLTFFYRDATGEDILDPEDMSDLSGGKWKIKKCEECGITIKISNHTEKYCTACKVKFVEGEGIKSRCYKCDKPLYKYVDGDEMVNKYFKSNRKKIETKLDTITNVKLSYGKMTVYTRCECGALNYKEIEKGWF